MDSLWADDQSYCSLECMQFCGCLCVSQLCTPHVATRLAVPHQRMWSACHPPPAVLHVPLRAALLCSGPCLCVVGGGGGGWGSTSQVHLPSPEPRRLVPSGSLAAEKRVVPPVRPSHRSLSSVGRGSVGFPSLQGCLQEPTGRRELTADPVRLLPLLSQGKGRTGRPAPQRKGWVGVSEPSTPSPPPRLLQASCSERTQRWREGLQ